MTINYIDFPEEELSEKFKKKYNITWDTPTLSIEEYIHVGGFCKMCTKGTLHTRKVQEINRNRNWETVPKQFCGNALCNNGVGVRKGAINYRV